MNPLRTSVVSDRVRACALGGALALSLGAGACGESRSPIGDECIRGDDCLSGVCSARICVAAPPLVTGANGPTPDETVRIPDGDAAPADSGPRDASEDGGG